MYSCISLTTVRAIIIQKSCSKRSRSQDTLIRKSTTHLDGLPILTPHMKLPTIVVFNMYNSYNDFGLKSLKVLAVALP